MYLHLSTQVDCKEMDPVLLRECHQNYSTIAKCCVSIKTGPKYALRGVTFGLRADQLLGLLGPNGAGKTTCCRLIVGEEAPLSGEVCDSVIL